MHVLLGGVNILQAQKHVILIGFIDCTENITCFWLFNWGSFTCFWLLKSNACAFGVIWLKSTACEFALFINLSAQVQRISHAFDLFVKSTCFCLYCILNCMCFWCQKHVNSRELMACVVLCRATTTSRQGIATSTPKVGASPRLRQTLGEVWWWQKDREAVWAIGVGSKPQTHTLKGQLQYRPPGSSLLKD